MRGLSSVRANASLEVAYTGSSRRRLLAKGARDPLHRNGTHALHKRQTLQQRDDVAADVDLAGLHSEIGRRGKCMVVVMPSLAQRRQCEPDIVATAVRRPERP